MNTKTAKIIYWIATSLLALMMLFSSTMYVVANDQVSEVITGMGFPSWILYPLGVAKILGIIAIITKKSDMLKEWAYAGFFFTFSLAISGHIMAADEGQYGAMFAIVLLLTSYFTGKKMMAA